MKRTQQKDSGKYSDFTINISPKWVSRFLLIVVAILAITSMTGQYLKYYTEYDSAFGLIPLFNMDKELSVPSIFSVLLLYSAAILLFVIAAIKWKQKAPHVWGWSVLTFGFIFLAFDEGATIHEKLMQPMHRLLGEEMPTYMYFPWVLPAIIGVVLIALFFLKFLIDLPKKSRIDFILSAVVYLGGALGFELVCAQYASMFKLDNFGFNVLSTIEEVLEMVGMIMFIRSLFSYIEINFGKVQFTIGKPKA